MKKLALPSLAAIAIGTLTLEQWIAILGAAIGVLNILIELLRELKKRREEKEKEE